jgi:N-acetylglucosaminyl-diphospho-decaprenol L-rhamnosyltransferase
MTITATTLTPTVTPARSGGGRAAGALAFAVVAWDALDHIRESLPRLLEVASELDAQVVVVDNASTDGTREFLSASGEAQAAQIQLIANRRNRGYAAAAKQAAAAVPGCDLFLVNPDVTIASASDVLRMVSVMDDLPRAGVLAPRLVAPDGKPQPSARTFPGVLAMAGHASAARRIGLARRAAERYLALPEGDRPTQVDWAIGAALLIRREAWETVGGFDERFFLYLEDTDFCLRCSRVDWETWYVPEISLRHEYARASAPEKGWVGLSAARRHHVASMVRFFAKHPRLAFHH